MAVSVGEAGSFHRDSGQAGSDFASDNHAGVHPDVFAAMLDVNSGHVPSYGDDQVTRQAERLFRQHFGEDIDVFFVLNGTGANVIGLQAMLRPYEGVICAASSHINVDECGAPERFLGSKLIDVPTPDGKLTPKLLDEVERSEGDQHRVQPRVVSISQPTEVGTLYTLEQIQEISSWSHAHNMLLHVDGARLSNAAATLDVELGRFGSALGVDVLSYGGTKNGAMAAEAVVVFPSFMSGAKDSLPYIRKQSMQLASKMRFIAAQFTALLNNDLWRRNAAHANAMAQRLAEGVGNLPSVHISYPVEANAVFATLPRDITAALQQNYPFYMWDAATGQVRWMTSFDTTEADVDTFVETLRHLVSRGQQP